MYSHLDVQICTMIEDTVTATNRLLDIQKSHLISEKEYFYIKA